MKFGNRIFFIKRKKRLPNLKNLIEGDEEKILISWITHNRKSPELKEFLSKYNQNKYKNRYKDIVFKILSTNSFPAYGSPDYQWLKIMEKKDVKIRDFMISFKFYKEGDPKAVEIINLLKEKLGIK